MPEKPESQSVETSLEQVDLPDAVREYVRRHNKIALVFPFLIIHNDDHLARSQVFYYFMHLIKFHMASHTPPRKIR